MQNSMDAPQKMKIEVASTGLLHIEGLEKEGFVELAAGATVTDLLNIIKIQQDHQRFVTAFVNGEEKNRSAVLRNGDKVTLLLPIGGG